MNNLSHLTTSFDSRNGKMVSPIVFPADLTPEAYAYLATQSSWALPRRAQIRAYVKAWIKARETGFTTDEAHVKGCAAIKLSYAKANARHFVGIFRQAGYKFQA